MTEGHVSIDPNTYEYFNPAFQHLEGTTNNGVQHYKGNYTTHVLSKFGLQFIDKAAQANKPFYIGLAPVACHQSAGGTGNKDAHYPTPEKKYENTMGNLNVPDSDNFNPAERSGVNGVWRSDRLNATQLAVLQKYYQTRIETLQSVDDMVEAVVTSLKNHNVLDNTYIIYSADNGFHLGQHRLTAGKKTAFEEDINVPLIIRGPGVPKGQSSNLVTAHVDLAPTIMNLAGIDHQGFDGKQIPVKNPNGDGGNTHDEYTGVEFWTGQNFSKPFLLRESYLPCLTCISSRRPETPRIGKFLQGRSSHW